MSSLEEDVRRLKDRAQILEIFSGYCRHADLGEADAMASVFTEDTIVKFFGDLPEALHGRTAVRDYFVSFLGNVVTGSHYVTNAELIFDTPDKVRAHFYMYSVQRFKAYPVAADCHRFGRYESLWLRTPEGWKINRMKLLSALEYGDTRIGEHFNRAWPPRFDNF